MLRFLKSYHNKAGYAPGFLVPHDFAEAPDASFHRVVMTAEAFRDEEVGLTEIDPNLRKEGEITWYRVTGGLHDAELIQELGNRFNLHRLVPEDIMNLGHRPKLEAYDSYAFIVLKNITRNPDEIKALPSQVCLLMGEGWVLSFEEREVTTWSGILERMKVNHARFVQRGAEYTVYALLDALVDNAFGLLDQFDAQLEEIEGDLNRKIKRSSLMKAYEIRRELILIRRWITPMRDLTGQLIRGEVVQIREETRMFMRDVHDHLEQLIDATQIFSEMADSMVAIHLSASSQQSTEVMQTLTVIATIFIPLTFIAGIYGMNFDFMPELHWSGSYYVLWGVFVVVTLAMLQYFRRKKWL